MSTTPGTQDGPIMDGATDDMSDNGTSKVEAQDLQEAGRSEEIHPPDALGTGGLGDNPLGRSEGDEPTT